MTSEQLKLHGKCLILIRHFRNLAEQLRQKANENEREKDESAALAFEASASSVERVCDEVSQMVARGELRPVH